MFPGVGTLVNVVAVLTGGSLGIVVGHRLPQRTRDVVTDALGLTTLLIAALSAAQVTAPALHRTVGPQAPVLIVLGSLLVGGIAGSLLRIEERLEGLGASLQRRWGGHPGTSRTPVGERRRRFVEGFLSSTLVFCVGPLTILGALDDGLGLGPDKLLLKSTLDGFASIAFAASLGWGVVAAALPVLVVQGLLTALGAALGSFLSTADVAALTATGGLLLAGVGVRLLRIRPLPVGDLLPALVVAPVLVEVVAALR